MIGLQQIINSSLSLRLVSVLAQRLSPRLGYSFAHFVGDQIARQRNSRLVRAVRANQWVIRGENLDGEALDRVVRETFHNWARSIFDLYHYVDDPDATKQLIVVEPSFQKFVQRPEFDARGLVLIGLHLSNFDLILQWLSRQGMRPLALTLPDPQGGRRMEYEMRRRTGLNLVPGSVGALRKAIKYLQQGGMVLTGIDRPTPDPDLCPSCFSCDQSSCSRSCWGGQFPKRWEVPCFCLRLH
jgi:KDO2-lipid IV(A) lauroyltransferase